MVVSPYFPRIQGNGLFSHKTPESMESMSLGAWEWIASPYAGYRSKSPEGVSWAVSRIGCVLFSLHVPLPLSMGHLEGFLFSGTFPSFGMPGMYVSLVLVFSLPPVLHLWTLLVLLLPFSLPQTASHPRDGGSVFFKYDFQVSFLYSTVVPVLPRGCQSPRPGNPAVSFASEAAVLSEIASFSSEL